MSRFYVNISGLTNEQLAFFGYRLVHENHDFSMYIHYSGDEHIVQKDGPRYIYVDDLNDALAMQATDIVKMPTVS